MKGLTMEATEIVDAGDKVVGRGSSSEAASGAVRPVTEGALVERPRRFGAAMSSGPSCSLSESLALEWPPAGAKYSE